MSSSKKSETKNNEKPIDLAELVDAFDFLVVSVRAENLLGQFVFPKTVLCEKGIVSCNGKEGKRAMRIYPPWDKTDNSQAKKTQAWQLHYFIKLRDVRIFHFVKNPQS